MAGKPWHRGAYQVRARKVREAANADSLTRCWRCGGLGRDGDPWQAGHIVDGAVNGPLAPEHRSCNTRAGQRLSSQRGEWLRTSRLW